MDLPTSEDGDLDHPDIGQHPKVVASCRPIDPHLRGEVSHGGGATLDGSEDSQTGAVREDGTDLLDEVVRDHGSHRGIDTVRAWTRASSFGSQILWRADVDSSSSRGVLPWRRSPGALGLLLPPEDVLGGLCGQVRLRGCTGTVGGAVASTVGLRGMATGSAGTVTRVAAVVVGSGGTSSIDTTGGGRLWCTGFAQT